MPELISRYPDVAVQILREAGANCGVGREPQILKKCPAERFCSLPTGELCIYGIEDIPMMTQISARDLAPIVCRPEESGAAGSTLLAYQAAYLLAAFAAGIVVGALARRVEK